METKRDEVIKGLEYCTSSDRGFYCPQSDCPYGDVGNCVQLLMAHTLALINELTEENERLRAIPEQLHKEMSERMIEERKIERKLAVIKMQTALTTFFANDEILKYNEVDADYINEQINKIINEFLEGKYDRTTEDMGAQS